MTPATSHDRQQEQVFPLPQRIGTRRKSYGRLFHVGDKVEAEDSQKKWYPARIIEVDEADNCVLIHFDGFNARYDEWIEMGSSKLRQPAKRGRDASPLQHLKVGEAVLARWTDGRFYEARVADVSEESYRVEFYDGLSRTLSPNNIKPLESLTRVQSRSRSRSGQSSVEPGSTPNTVNHSSTRSSLGSRRVGRPSRQSSAVSSCATSPLDSHPDSPEEGIICGVPPNGHNHQALELQLRGVKRRRSFGSDSDSITSELSTSQPATSCGMSSSCSVSNGEGHATNEALLPLVSNGCSRQNLPANLTGCSPILPSTSPPSSLKSSPPSSQPYIAQTLQNGFHTPNGIVQNNGSGPSSKMPPCTAIGDNASFDLMDDDDIVSPIIAPPTLPNFTPLSPRSSPQRSLGPTTAPPTMSHLASNGSVDSVATCSSPICSTTECSSAPSKLVSVCETPLVTNAIVSQLPAITAAVSCPLVSRPKATCTEATSTPVVKSDPDSNGTMPTRHEVARAPSFDVVPGRRSSESDSSTSSRPKRKKVDGVLTPPPAKIAPKEVIPVEDHNPFKCRVCEKSFRKWLLLECHYKHYHPDNRREFQMSKKEYEKKPLPSPAHSKKDVDRCTKNPDKKAPVPLAKAVSSSTPRSTSSRLRSAATDVVKRKDLPSVVPANVSTPKGSSKASNEPSSATPATSQPSCDASCSSVNAKAVNSSASQTVPSKAKRKASGDGPPAKRGRPPLSATTLSSASVENTPKLPVPMHGAVAVKNCSVSSSSDSSGSNVQPDKAAAGQRDHTIRLPKSRRSLSFSWNESTVDACDDGDAPVVKTDHGVKPFPLDGLLCCPCRQEEAHGVLVKCNTCLSHQHLACILSSFVSVSWARYRCRACTHPGGKRRGARDKVPVDWYNSQSVCRNPYQLLSPRAALAPGISPLASQDESPSSRLEYLELQHRSQYVGLQQACSQDILAVGEVLAATMKQLQVIQSPEKSSHRIAINRLLPPRVKVDPCASLVSSCQSLVSSSSNLVSPIQINTEPIHANRPRSTPTPTSTSDVVKATFATRHLPSPSAKAEAGDGDSPMLVTVEPLAMAAGVVDAKSPIDFAKDIRLRKTPPSCSSPVSYKAEPLVASSVTPNVQHVVDCSRVSPPLCASPAKVTSRPVSPLIAPRSHVVVSPQAVMSPAAVPNLSRRPPLVESISAANTAVSVSRKHACSPSAVSTMTSPAQQNVLMSASVSPTRPVSSAMSIESLSPDLVAAVRGEEASAHRYVDAKLAQSLSHSGGSASSSGSQVLKTPGDDCVFFPIMPTTPSSTVYSPVVCTPLPAQKRPSSIISESKSKRSPPETEEEKNIRIQTARKEMLTRVHTMHSTLDKRLGKLEEVVGALEQMERKFQSSSSQERELSRRQQLAMFQRLMLAMDELHVPPAS